MRRELTAPVAAAVAYAYLADFSHAVSWDPATSAVSRLEGDGTAGTTYVHRVTLLGREVELEVETVEAEPPTRLVFRGTDGTSWLTHRITLAQADPDDPDDPGMTVVVLRTDYVFDLWRNIVTSVVGRSRAERQADETALRLHDELAALAC